jgi:hypothetical protein
MHSISPHLVLQSCFYNFTLSPSKPQMREGTIRLSLTGGIHRPSGPHGRAMPVTPSRQGGARAGGTAVLGPVPVPGLRRRIPLPLSFSLTFQPPLILCLALCTRSAWNKGLPSKRDNLQTCHRHFRLVIQDRHRFFISVSARVRAEMSQHKAFPVLLLFYSSKNVFRIVSPYLGPCRGWSTKPLPGWQLPLAVNTPFCFDVLGCRFTLSLSQSSGW